MVHHIRLGTAIALDWAGTLASGLHIAGTFDRTSNEDRAYARIAVAIARYAANKLCPLVVSEAMEAIGGMGYIEDNPLPILYREAPLNGIWEGSANVVCFDALRTVMREPLSAKMLTSELAAARGLDRHYDAALKAHMQRWPGEVSECEARWFVEATAKLLTASVLLRRNNNVLADAYVSMRFNTDRSWTRGAIPEGSAKQVLTQCFRTSTSLLKASPNKQQISCA